MKFTPEDFEPFIFFPDESAGDVMARMANAKLEKLLEIDNHNVHEVYSHSYEEGGRAWRHQPDPRSKHKAKLFEVHDYRWECPACGEGPGGPACGYNENAQWPWKKLYDIRKRIGCPTEGMGTDIIKFIEASPTVYQEESSSLVTSWKAPMFWSTHAYPDDKYRKVVRKAKLVCIEEIK